LGFGRAGDGDGGDGEFFEPEFYHVLPVEQELGGDIAEIAQLKFSVDLVEFADEVTDLFLIGLQVAFLNGFHVDEAEALDIVLVCLAPIGSGAAGNAELFGNALVTEPFRSKGNEVIDCLLVMHSFFLWRHYNMCFCGNCVAAKWNVTGVDWNGPEWTGVDIFLGEFRLTCFAIYQG